MADYYYARRVPGTMGEVESRVVECLGEEGFGVLTRIDVQDILRKKLDEDFRPYVILGACNPEFAHRALSMEDRIGTMLPCNVVLQETGEGDIEVAAVDPVASMSAVHNKNLGPIAGEVGARLRRAIDAV